MEIPASIRTFMVAQCQRPMRRGAAVEPEGCAGALRREAAWFRLYDPVANRTEPVTGEFRPWSFRRRPLQPTNQQHVVWVALPSFSHRRFEGSTSLGRYDTRSFVFTPVLELPDLPFSSDEMWVDESHAKVYVAYNGHLLSVPLPAP